MVGEGVRKHSSERTSCELSLTHERDPWVLNVRSRVSQIDWYIIRNEFPEIGKIDQMFYAYTPVSTHK